MNPAIRLDYSVKKNRITIQKELRKIGSLAAHPEGKPIPLEALEEVMRMYQRDYHYEPHWITIHYHKAEADYWYSSNIRLGNACTLVSVQGNTLYELWAKAALAIHSALEANVWKKGRKERG